MENKVSVELTVSTGTPRGFAVLTYDCASTQDNNIRIKYADDTTFLGVNKGGDKKSCRALVNKNIVDGENLFLNIHKT